MSKIACRWLSSGLIALVISCIAFLVLGLAYERFELQERLGMDDDVCWLALLIGPAMIVLIHRGFHRRPWTARSTLVGGLLLAGLGAFQFLQARDAAARHQPSGLFSGIEHTFALVLSVILVVIAALLVLGALLALAARRGQGDADPRALASTSARTPVGS